MSAENADTNGADCMSVCFCSYFVGEMNSCQCLKCDIKHHHRDITLQTDATFKIALLCVDVCREYSHKLMVVTEKIRTQINGGD